MIRPLRRRHRVMMVGLALTVPALFAAGLLARRPMPEVVLPPALSAPAFDPADVLSRQFQNTGRGLGLSITTLKPTADSDRLRLVVQLLSDPKRPELLVYWRPRIEAPKILSGPRPLIGDDNYLLGTLDGTAPVVFVLPVAATDTGSLGFFSLAQQEVVDWVELRPPAARGDK